jgi:hypothetical protein
MDDRHFQKRMRRNHPGQHGRNEQGFDDQINKKIEKITVEILTLKPTMSYGVTQSSN